MLLFSSKHILQLGLTETELIWVGFTFMEGFYFKSINYARFLY